MNIKQRELDEQDIHSLQVTIISQVFYIGIYRKKNFFKARMEIGQNSQSQLKKKAYHIKKNNCSPCSYKKAALCFNGKEGNIS